MKKWIKPWIILAIVLVSQNVAAQKKPNIIVFLADDLNQKDLGCYGNTDVQTPHMDQLAEEGMRFTRAYAASSMCTPSRAVMFTGLYPYKNGAQMNHFTVNAGIKSLPHYLQNLGYRVVISGKIHISPETSFPFEVTGQEFGKYLPVENRTDRKKASVNLIREHFKNRSNEPLCLIVAPWLPHVPWFPHRDFDPQKIKIPSYLADTRETRGALASYYQSISATDKMLGEVMDAVEQAGEKDNTVFMFTSDQGAQFPSAKWTVYDKGLNVPFIVRWPGKVQKKTVSDALISLVDFTPTLIDISGGEPIAELDGKSFKPVLEDKKKHHHSYVFAETTVEPHYWYNYTPSRSVITAEGYHYIRNYHPGTRFITHIDKVERNEFYFDSWVSDARTNPHTAFLLNRYSYRPPEELFNINKDPNEFENLADSSRYKTYLTQLSELLQKELSRQGEQEAMIMEGTLPLFSDKSYSIAQNKGAVEMSFNRKLWNPDTLFITAYLNNVNKGGVVCEYFNNFRLYAYQSKIGIVLPDGNRFESEPVETTNGQLLVELRSSGIIEIYFNNKKVLKADLKADLTKIKSGYVTCGKIQGMELPGHLQPYRGKIYDLRFTMNDLSGVQ